MPDNKTPMGKPLDLTDDEIELLSEVTPDDINMAAVFWRENAPVEFKNILDAEEGEA